MKFRIITNGRDFRVQYRVSFSPFWQNFYVEDDRGDEFFRSFDSLQEAEKFIEIKKIDLGVEKWSVVKTMS